MNTKRFLIKACKILIVSVFILLAFENINTVVYNNITLDELSLQERYEDKKEKCELLKTIAHNLIEEGKGINTQGITCKEIRYEIFNDGTNIFFHYYIKPSKNNSRDNYEAKITLNNNYKILDEEYSIELEDYETYKYVRKRLEEVCSVIISVLLTLGICIIVHGTYKVWGVIKNRKVEKPKKTEVQE